MWVRVNSQKPLVVVLAGLVILCWIALWAWGASPYGRFLSHTELGHVRLGDELRLVVLFVAGWTLMTIAMMLPTSLPLVALFYGMMGRRSDRRRLLVLLLMGYVGLWTLFGIGAHIADFFLHQMVERVAWLEANEWVISAGTLVLAGLYQFSSLKYKCLDKCRSPMSFITQHWRGQQPALHALRLGMHHALFCIGCCWALMLLMFAVGVGSILWMLGLGIVMAVEKNMPWGRRLAAPLGACLIGWALVVVLRGVVGI